MAASRIERFTTILKRCEGLMKGNVMKKKPLWYDIYVKVPPFDEPNILREKPNIKLREILYSEDIERAKQAQGIIVKQKIKNPKSENFDDFFDDTKN